jgi:hypothetical protein
MSRFRKLPVEIEAYRFDNRITNQPPSWVLQAKADGVVRVEIKPLAMFIQTLEGEMRADEGDWIIQGIKGEIYPCKPDIFEATYEPVEVAK